MRDRHVYIIGKSGMGKSTLMLQMIRQDIANGKGVGVIDPHADLVRNVLRYVPQSRVKDTILFDAESLPIGLNFFNAKTDAEKELISDDVIVLFKRLSDSWGERMDMVLRYTVRTLAEVAGATFLDIYRMLADDYFRDTVLRQVRLQPLLQFWREVYPKFPHPVTEQPILSRMGKFAVNSTLRTIVGTASSLNFFDVMQQGKILLCNISKAAVGTDTSAILGAMLVSQFQLAAMRRGRLHPSKRRPFYLFIDEFQTFQTSAFNEIITESRKYQLCLTLANQKLEDLDQKTRGAAQGAETTIVFRPYEHEAATLAKWLPEKFGPETLKDLDKLEFVIRAGKASNTKRCHLEFPPPPPKGYVEEIKAATRAAYPLAPAPDLQAVTAPSDEVEAGPPPG
jgi:hypothetical protein